MRVDDQNWNYITSADRFTWNLIFPKTAGFSQQFCFRLPLELYSQLAKSHCIRADFKGGIIKDQLFYTQVSFLYFFFILQQELKMDDIPSAFVDENTPLIHRDQTEERQETLKDLKGHIKPLLSALYMIVVAGLNDGTLGSIIPRVKQYYDIPNETVSLLFLCSSIGFFTSALMNGFIVHRIGQLNTIYMGSCLQLLSYLILMMGFPFPVMAAAMVCTGLGTGITDAAMNVFVASLPMATLMLNILHGNETMI
jgi:hypothetical protein